MKRKLFKCTVEGPSFLKQEDKPLDLTMEKIESYIDSKTIPSITHNEWIEDGVRYSSWRLNTGSITINTGDAGMKLIEEEFKKQGMKYGK